MLPEPQQDIMLSRILGEARVPLSELVDGLNLTEVDLPPTPCVTVRTPMQTRGTDDAAGRTGVRLRRRRVPSFPPGKVAVQTDRSCAIRRDVRAEQKARERLEELGFRET